MKLRPALLADPDTACDHPIPGQKRIIVEDDSIEGVGLNPSLLQAIVDRDKGERELASRNAAGVSVLVSLRCLYKDVANPKMR